MPRFWDITVLLTCMSLAIGLVNGMGIFTMNYMQQPNASSAYDTSQVYNTINSTKTTGSMDAFTASVGFFAMGIGFLVNFAVDTIGLYGTMTTLFHMPALVAAFLTGIIGLIWLSFFIQLITRMGWGLVKD
jgi:hypothetical protein